MRRDRLPTPIPAPLQPYLARPRRRRTGPDGNQRLDLPPDAHPLGRQRPRHPRPLQLRPHHGRHHLTPAMARPAAHARAQRSAGPRAAARATRPRHARHGHGRPAMQDLTRQPQPHRTRPKPCPAAAASRTRHCPMPGGGPQTESTAITQGHLPHNAESLPAAPNTHACRDGRPTVMTHSYRPVPGHMSAALAPEW
jgi:hypothetical protein